MNQKFTSSVVIALCLFGNPGTAQMNSDDLKQKRMENKGEDVIEVRDAQTVAKRCIALLAVIGRVHEKPATRVVAWVKRNKINNYFSPRERAVFFKSELTVAEQTEFSWKAEALVSMLWALGVIKDFPNLTDQYDVYQHQAVQDAIQNPEAFVKNARLRVTKDIEEMEAHLYHQHWRVRDAQLFNRPMPSDLNPDIVYERRYGLSWVVGWGESWEDVPTDT